MGKIREVLFGREPLLALALVAALLGVLTALHVGGFSAAQVPLILALITAVVGALQAAFTRPWAPAAFTAVIGAAATLLGAYHYHVSDELIVAIDGVIVAIPPLLVRPQVTPTLKLRAIRRAAARTWSDLRKDGEPPVVSPPSVAP